MDEEYLRGISFNPDDQYAFGENNGTIFLQPLDQSATPQSSIMAQAHRKRQDSGFTSDQAAKKRITDREYRRRCKEAKEATITYLGMLTEENNHLKQENGLLKKEAIQLKKSSEFQEVEMKQLRRETGQLKGELSRQNIVVEVLSKRLAQSDDISLLQVDNAQLKCQIDLLKKSINNPEDLNIIELQGKMARLEHENRAFHVIIDALCKKINNDPEKHVKEHVLVRREGCSSNKQQ